jgi:hypothetical protein
MLMNALGAEFRQFLNRDHEGKPSRVVVAVRTYDTAPLDLWDALTTASVSPAGFCRSKAT